MSLFQAPQCFQTIKKLVEEKNNSVIIYNDAIHQLDKLNSFPAIAFELFSSVAKALGYKGVGSSSPIIGIKQFCPFCYWSLCGYHKYYFFVFSCFQVQVVLCQSETQ